MNLRGQAMNLRGQAMSRASRSQGNALPLMAA
jgi:hypothetical protein